MFPNNKRNTTTPSNTNSKFKAISFKHCIFFSNFKESQSEMHMKCKYIPFYMLKTSLFGNQPSDQLVQKAEERAKEQLMLIKLKLITLYDYST